MNRQETAITPTRAQDYPEWYQQVIKAADLAENSVVRGCMVIKPWGYAIWELMQKNLDRMFKETGHTNAYFPLFIPLSYLAKEAKHVDGFAKECAVVTHHRLVVDPETGGLKPSSPLEEPLVVRPTSETIIGETYAKWVQSYRDLPILINQWANVVRWEMRTRLFLRTTEFLWQEGHTVHATAEEAIEETRRMLDVYEVFARDYMAMPVVKGEKTTDERFPGAVNTYAIEAMMQDGKALQAGTSHFLGQNFARASNIKFLSKNEKEEIAWTTSWGVSTRLIGGLIMTHSDDDGLILPPRLAPQHVVILPIFKTDAEKTQVLDYCEKLKLELKDQHFAGDEVRAFIDDRDVTGGARTWNHIKRGVPLRIEVGPRDIAKDALFVGRRDQAPRDKKSIPRSEMIGRVGAILGEIQNNLYERALKFSQSNTQRVQSLKEFEAFFADESKSGFVLAYAADASTITEHVKNLKVSARCMPLDSAEDRGTCLWTGMRDARLTLFARAY